MTDEIKKEPRWKEWRSLTDEEIRQHVMPYLDNAHFPTVLYLARLLEKILKERNT